MKIRQLIPEDAEIFRNIRLEGLQNAPNAFGADYEQELAYELEEYKKWIANHIIWGGFQKDYLIGIVGLANEISKPKRAHKGFIWGMYVRPEFRNQGVGRALIESVLAKAPLNIEQVQITVMSENPWAEKLYKSLGFQTYGHEQESIKVNGKYFDEIHMVKFLKT